MEFEELWFGIKSLVPKKKKENSKKRFLANVSTKDTEGVFISRFRGLARLPHTAGGLNR